MEKLYNFIKFRQVEYIIFFLVIFISVGLFTTRYYLFSLFSAPLILFLLLLVRYPQVGFYIILFLVSFNAFTELSPYGGLSISKLTGIFTSVVILFYFLLKKKNTFNIGSNLWVWLLFFLLINLVSTLMSDYSSTSFSNMARLFIAFTFVAMTLIFVSRMAFCNILPTVIIWSTSISSFFAIIGYVFNIPFFTLDSSMKRGTGTVSDPNFASCIIIFCLPLLCYRIFYSRSSSGKIAAIALFVINITAIILTYSRGGALVMVIVLGLLFIDYVHRLRPKHLGFAGILAAITITTLIIFMPATYLDRLKSVGDTSSSKALGERESHLHVGWEALKENPVIGSGPGTHRDVYATSRYAIEFRRGKGGGEGSGDIYKRVAHNAYIEVITGTGLLGLISFLLIIWFALRNFYLAHKNFKYNGGGEMASLVRAYTISFISLLLYFFLLSQNNHKYFWLSIALSQVAIRLSLEMRPKDENPVSTVNG